MECWLFSWYGYLFEEWVLSRILIWVEIRSTWKDFKLKTKCNTRVQTYNMYIQIDEFKIKKILAEYDIWYETDDTIF